MTKTPLNCTGCTAPYEPEANAGWACGYCLGCLQMKLLAELYALLDRAYEDKDEQSIFWLDYVISHYE